MVASSVDETIRKTVSRINDSINNNPSMIPQEPPAENDESSENLRESIIYYQGKNAGMREALAIALGQITVLQGSAISSSNTPPGAQ